MPRPSRLVFVGLGALGLVAVAAAGGPLRAQGGSQPGVLDGPDCIRVYGQASYHAGYRHVVVVQNGCSGTAQCEVSTSVDPQPTYHLTVPAGESREQITRIGSPAYEFQARATCTVEGGSGGGSGSEGD